MTHGVVSLATRTAYAVDEQLHVGCDGELPRQLPAAEDLGGVLVPQPRAESVFVGLTPVEVEPGHRNLHPA